MTNSANSLVVKPFKSMLAALIFSSSKKKKKERQAAFHGRLQKYFRSAACCWPSPVLKHTPNVAFCFLDSFVKGQPCCGMSLAHKSTIGDQTALSLCSGWAPTCTFLSDLLPRLGGSRRSVHWGWETQATRGAQSKWGGKSYPASCPSQRRYHRSIAACRQPEGAARCQT